MSEVCFASWHGFAGCLASARHAAGELGGTWLALGEEEAPAEALECGLLVLSSWAPSYVSLLSARPGPTVGRWHSSLLQTELSREGWKLSTLVELLEEGRLAALAMDDPEVVAALARPNVVHLPNVFDRTELLDVSAANLPGLNVALPGEAHGRKNLLVQTAAFDRARRGREWALHLFGQTLRRPGYARWLELAGVPHVEHGFLPRQEYLALAAAMDVTLCASLSESYGYAAAEAVELGVPVVATRAVRSFDAGPLTVGDPSSVAEVAGAIQLALEDASVAEAQRDSLHRRAAANSAIARAALTELAELVSSAQPESRGAEI